MRFVRSLLAAIVLGACAGGEPPDSRAEGVIESVDPVAKRVTIDHGEIPDLMGAMTMTFDVADAELLRDLEPGSRVRFSVRYADGQYLVTDIQRK